MDSVRRGSATRTVGIPRFRAGLWLLAGAAMLAMPLWGYGQPQRASTIPHMAQTATATIEGVAGGPDGEVYQGVRVTLTMTGGSPAYTQTQITDADGSFRFSNVTAEPFRLTIDSPGFRTQTVADVLHAGEVYDAHTIVLLVAAATSTVQVNASRVEIAQAQLDIEEKQRVLGVLPNFLVSYDPHAAPLNIRQKFQLSWKTAVDPTSFGLAALFAGVDQAGNAQSGYGPGAKGYAKRFGAVYSDSFIGAMIGGAVLPSIFRQDPRYFVKEAGSVRSRIWYAVYNSVMCKGDNGRWQVNYSGLLGGAAAGGISNLYHPANDRDGAGAVFAGTAIVAGTNIFGNLAQEFVMKKLTPTARKREAGQL